MTARTIGYLIPIALLLAAGAALAQAGAPLATKTVLLLSSERSDFPAASEFERGLREGLADPAGGVQLYVEHLDFGRFPAPDYGAMTMRHLGERYAGRRIDVVVAFVDAAFEFALAHRARLFPGVPLVGAAVEQRTPRPLPRGVSVVPSVFDYRRTLSLALELQPDAREVVAVHGLAEFDLRRRDEARPVLEALAPRVSYRFLSGVPLAAIEQEARALPPGSLVLLISMVKDAEGRALVGADYAARLAAVSSAPVYSTFDSHLRRGALAGAITDWAAIGRAAASAARQALAGDPPPAFAAVDAPLRVNWRAVEKWSIAPGRIPGEAQVLFRGPGLWDEYRGFVVSAVIAVLLQALLISGLLLQLKRRRRAEAELRTAMEEMLRKEQQIEHITRFSTMGDIAASLAHELSQPLGAILANSQAGLRFLDQGKLDAGEMREILQDVVADDRRAGEVVGALRSMLRRERAESTRLDVAQLAHEVLLLLRGELVAQHIEVQVECAADCFVMANKTQVEQVLLNLLMNAVDAMRAQPGAQRRLRVEVTRSERAVQVAVRDSGVGIPAEEIGKVFEPFWTTKASGMGMGLSISSSILRSYGGSIMVEPNPGAGVTFRFTLPLAPPPVQNPAQP